MVKSLYFSIIIIFFSLSIQATPIDVSQLAIAGMGTVASPWTGWDTAVTWVGEQEYYFPGGIYCYSVSPNFLKTGIALRGEAGTVLKHTGSGNAVVFDNPGGQTPINKNWTMNVRMENFIIQGNSATTNGLFLRGVRDGYFKHISVRDVSGAGLWTEACVTNILENFRVMFQENPNYVWNVKPAYGIVIAGRGADTSTTWTITNPVIEDVSMIGIWIKAGCFSNTIINGTVENNHTPGFQGIVLDGYWNTLINTDFEGNVGTDIAINQSRNILINLASSNQTTLGPSQQNQFIGGNYHNITLHPYDASTILQGVYYTGALVNPSLATIQFGNQGTPFTFDSRFPNVIGTARSLAYGPSVSTDATLSQFFNLVTYGGFVLNNPTSPTDGETITWRIWQNSTGTSTIAFGSKFRPKQGQPLPQLTTVPSGLDYIKATYRLLGDVWDIQ
jgi:hypothetical protein